MYFVRPSTPTAAVVFQAKTFRQTVKWCLAAEKDGSLQHASYDIIGSDSSLDDPEFMATFVPDRRGARPLARVTMPRRLPTCTP